MHNTKAIRTARSSIRNAQRLSVEKTLAGKRYTVTEEGRVVFTATSVDDVDYFLKLHTGNW